MNAIQFIKEYGVDKAREELNKLPNSNVTHMTDDARMFVDENNPLLYEFQRSQIKDLICIEDLKRLVESVDLVGKYHSINHAKNHYNNMREALNQYQYENKDIEDLSNELKQAIADCESIYCVVDMGDDTHIENHVSPNCKVGVK